MNRIRGIQEAKEVEEGAPDLRSGIQRSFISSREKRPDAFQEKALMIGQHAWHPRVQLHAFN